MLSAIRNPPHLSRYWLLLGVIALAVAGLFSLVLVIARTPSLASLPVFADIFHKSLVVHVDLSVLVWFLSIACLLWSLLASHSPQLIPYLEESALISFALGMVSIAASPLDPKAAALMSNYIPVITSPLFFLGLSLLLCGVGLMLMRLLTSSLKSPAFPYPVRFALSSAGLIALITIMAFIWSFQQMPQDITPAADGQQYYELVFWGGGHVLQFMHTQILIAGWLLLALAFRPHLTMPRPILLILLCIGLATACTVPIVYMLYNVTSMKQHDFFTHAMIMAGGIAPTLLAFYLIPTLWQGRSKNALWSTLAMSILLFIYGGLLGGAIQGQNVVIPAHYHGSIVGVTLAFMGIAYLLLPQFGYRDVRAWRIAYWQPIVYGGGQLLHISGLAWSGGYGVLRKTPGGMDALSTGVKAAMGMMGLGGMIAIIGGFMFVIVVGKSVLRKKS